MSNNMINEEMHLEKEWYEQARKQTLETLPDFIGHVMNDYQHDYGTVCIAIGACALAAAFAANKEAGACGGITGFQAGFVMWEFIQQWSYRNNRTGLRILNYDDLLYPQYGHKFEKTITPSTWEAVQKAAKEDLETDHGYSIHPDVIAHWQSIASGVIPFGFVVKED